MLDYEVKETADDKTLLIKGELTIENVVELQGIIFKALGATDKLMLNLEKVTKVDLSCLQLLCSAHKTVRASEKSFELSGNNSSTFNETVKEAGFLRHIGCNSECDANCLWADCDK